MKVRARVWLLTCAVVLFNVLGNSLLSLGLRNAPRLGASPVPYILVMANPAVLAGIVLLVSWMLSRMALLSQADLSFVLPVTSFGYVLSVAAGAILLGEHVTAWRWLGALMIVAGTLLVGLTAPRTRSGA
jgi:uncharacterized membrane protein